MDADGANQHNLTPDKEDYTQAGWSPDSKTIHFYSFSADFQKLGFYLMNRDGSNKRRIHKEFDVDTVWSPDGAYLASWNINIKDGLRFNNLVIMKPDGSGRVVLTNFDKAYRLLSWGK
jgi:Tol biopolymer transport system component